MVSSRMRREDRSGRRLVTTFAPLTYSSNDLDTGRIRHPLLMSGVGPSQMCRC